MRTMIFNQGKGWYISCKNYKDPEDRCFIDLYFPQNTAPEFKPSEKGWDNLFIDIQQGKFTSYKKKAGLTIFAYEVISREDPYEEVKDPEPVQNFRTEEVELPFY